MIVDSLAEVIDIILLPYKIQNHFVGIHAPGVLDAQKEDVKFLDCQRDYLAPHRNKALL